MHGFTTLFILHLLVDVWAVAISGNEECCYEDSNAGSPDILTLWVMIVSCYQLLMLALFVCNMDCFYFFFLLDCTGQNLQNNVELKWLE